MPEPQLVLITGAAAGAGRTIAERFIANGDRVHVCDVSAAHIDDFRRANPDATASVCDIADRKSLDRLFADLRATVGCLDVLVNNAGIAGPTAPVDEHDEEGWERCIQINLSGTFYVTRRAVPLLEKSHRAAIINIASTAAMFGYPLRSSYAASKWGMIGLTRTWAMELGPRGIRVNAVCPTSIEGPRIERVIEREARQRGISAEEVRASYLRQTSLQSFISADEVADTVLFLASDAARKISGQSIAIDGNTESLS